MYLPLVSHGYPVKKVNTPPNHQNVHRFRLVEIMITTISDASNSRRVFGDLSSDPTSSEKTCKTTSAPTEAPVVLVDSRP